MPEISYNGKLGPALGILSTVIMAISIIVTYTLWATSREEERNTREQVRAEIIANRITKLEVVVENLKETVHDLRLAVEQANNDIARRQLHDVPK